MLFASEVGLLVVDLLSLFELSVSSKVTFCGTDGTSALSMCDSW
jgi:hypothetical protein